MKYCARCIIPNTRPHIAFDDEGICNACRSAEQKRVIDWNERERSFRQLVQNIRAMKREYDCLIPVSGGKDSTWQVITCLEAGLKPLAVTWRTPGRTAIGQQNLDNLIRLGVDHIDFSINPDVERRFMIEALKRYGSTAIPMHMAIFNVPLTVAVRYRIPLVVWGENSAFEYGGSGEEVLGHELTKAWVTTYGVTHGTTAQDWISNSLTARDLVPYFGPLDDELAAAGLRAIFLGYYFEWDIETSRAVAATHGFRASSGGPKTGLYDFADIDDDFISIHHYLKWYKFGFTRLFDNLSIEIRRGRMTRETAIATVRQLGEQTPNEDIAKLCTFLQIPVAEFWSIIEKFRNLDIWYQDQGTWKIREFLIGDWHWR